MLDSGVIHFRMPKGVKKDLEKAAKEEKRSFASQCSFILEQWVTDRKAEGRVLAAEKAGTLNVLRQGNG